MAGDDVQLVAWSDADADLLAALNGDEAQMAHGGGAETAARIAERQAPGRARRSPRPSSRRAVRSPARCRPNSIPSITKAPKA